MSRKRPLTSCLARKTNDWALTSAVQQSIKGLGPIFHLLPADLSFGVAHLTPLPEERLSSAPLFSTERNKRVRGYVTEISSNNNKKSVESVTVGQNKGLGRCCFASGGQRIGQKQNRKWRKYTWDWGNMCLDCLWRWLILPGYVLSVLCTCQIWLRGVRWTLVWKNKRSLICTTLPWR